MNARWVAAVVCVASVQVRISAALPQNWQARSSPVNNNFVAVGDQGTSMTSPNACTWTLRESGTTLTLRAVTAIGSRFIAAGDGGVIITSTGGVTWTRGTSVSFRVTALAASSSAVVAVGNNDIGTALVQA